MIKPAMLFKPLPGNRVSCRLCAHRCRLDPNEFGKCGVRENRDGVLQTHVYGEVIAAHVDPIEKKPLYHYLPGTASFSIATIGCNFHCAFCQNWRISQENGRKGIGTGERSISPQEIVEAAVSRGCRSIAYTYTEPTVFFEFAYDTARIAHDRGLGNVFVTNGFMTAEALRTIEPYLDACNVDLKSFRDDFYRDICRGRLAPVLESIRLMKEMGIWVEVTTLILPGVNDSDGELEKIVDFIAGVDPCIPWHISRFHPDYEVRDITPTPVETLRRAYQTGNRGGLRHVYIGNVPGESEDTLCSECGRPLILRRGFSSTAIDIVDSRCPACGANIAGVF